MPFSGYPDAIRAIPEKDFKKVIQRTANSAISIPSGTTTVVASCFDGHNYLTGITIPNTVTFIGNRAFAGTMIRTINVPSSVTSFGNNVFIDCTALTAATISVQNLNSSTFSGCTSLRQVTIENATQILTGAFKECTALTEVNIPDTCTKIGEWAFWNASSLSAVTIGTGCTQINSNAFTGCTALRTITITATTPPTLGSTSPIPTTVTTIYVPSESVSSYQSAWASYASKIQAIPS